MKIKKFDVVDFPVVMRQSLNTSMLRLKKAILISSSRLSEMSPAPRA